jgi:hypothetical protein
VVQLHAPTALLQGKKTGTHWTEGWMGQTGVWTMWRRKKSLSCWKSNSDSPVVVPAASSLLITLTELSRHFEMNIKYNLISNYLARMTETTGADIKINYI